jgi:hypothetical protein
MPSTKCVVQECASANVTYDDMPLWCIRTIARPWQVLMSALIVGSGARWIGGRSLLGRWAQAVTSNILRWRGGM